MTSTRASGTTAVRYGTMRENVMALTVVLADGRVIQTGSRARKSAAGYDLTHLFVGAEGTLGVITEITLRLHPLPEAVGCGELHISTHPNAVETAIETIQLGVPVARMELMDEAQVDACNKYSKTNYPVAPTLFFEFHGDSERSVQDQAETVQEIAEEHHRARVPLVHDARGARGALENAARGLFRELSRSGSGGKMFTTDICVPISRLADCIVESKKDVATCSFPAPVVGHVGDGNFHMSFILDPEIPPSLPRRK